MMWVITWFLSIPFVYVAWWHVFFFTTMRGDAGQYYWTYVSKYMFGPGLEIPSFIKLFAIAATFGTLSLALLIKYWPAREQDGTESAEADGFETVHIVSDHDDGPRCGIADFDGTPHLFEAAWDDENDNFAGTYLLTPIGRDTLSLAMEDQAISRRWEAAFRGGLVGLDSHPALPEDRPRYEELQDLLAKLLVADPDRALRKRAEFRAPKEVASAAPGLWPLMVKWHDPA